jgi:hypothetical protein
MATALTPPSELKSQVSQRQRAETFALRHRLCRTELILLAIWRGTLNLDQSFFAAGLRDQKGKTMWGFAQWCELFKDSGFGRSRRFETSAVKGLLAARSQQASSSTLMSTAGALRGLWPGSRGALQTLS